VSAARMIPFSSKAKKSGSSAAGSCCCCSRYLVCPICFEIKGLDKGDLIGGAEMGGTVSLWQWIGDDKAVTFSY
jgi:hypothetical protein